MSDMATPRDAQFVMPSLVSSGTTRGELPFVRGSVSIASELAEKVTAIGWAGSKLPSTNCQGIARGVYDVPDLTTRQGYLETARTLLRAAHNMTDRAVAGQLKALADDYQRRAEKAPHVDAVKALARSAASAEREGRI
jgi:hypothetical protein